MRSFRLLEVCRRKAHLDDVNADFDPDWPRRPFRPCRSALCGRHRGDQCHQAARRPHTTLKQQTGDNRDVVAATTSTRVSSLNGLHGVGAGSASSGALHAPRLPACRQHTHGSVCEHMALGRRLDLAQLGGSHAGCAALAPCVGLRRGPHASAFDGHGTPLTVGLKKIETRV